MDGEEIMKLEIYKEKETKQEEKLVLRLIHGGDSVKLCAVDEDGSVLDGGYLLSIGDSDGDIGVKRCKYVSDSLGFDLDDDERIEWGDE